MTFEEFWNLPEAKRATAFKKLSSKDRMLVRQQQSSIGTVRVIPCNECKFRIGIMLACEAYPDGLTSDRIKSAMKHCEYFEQKVPGTIKEFRNVLPYKGRPLIKINIS